LITSASSNFLFILIDISKIIFPEHIPALTNARDSLLGPQELMTTSKPIKIADELCGGTFFERLGQKGVKDSRCYSLSLTHQYPRGVVGPAAGGKVYNGELSEHGMIRKKIVSVRTEYIYIYIYNISLH
jgi:hypothetical protein